MEFIDIKGTSQENIAKEVVEVAKRRGLELNFQVWFQTVWKLNFEGNKLLFSVAGLLEISKPSRTGSSTSDDL